MRLTDLRPKWITLAFWASPDPFYIGVSFQCPTCTSVCPTCGHDPAHRLAVNFWPPIDPADHLSRILRDPAWERAHARTGDTFETLTLLPSVGFDPHWHGFIRDGALVPA